MGNASSAPLAADESVHDHLRLPHGSVTLPDLNALVVASPQGDVRSRQTARRLIHSQIFGDSADHLPSPVSPSSPALAGKDPASVDLQAIVSVLHELRKTASPHDLLQLQKALLPASEASRNSTIHPHQMADAVYRRRSFLQPGVATRKDSPNLLRKSPPSALHKHSQGWSEDMLAVSSPLSKLSTLGKRPVIRHDHRADTPSDFDYSHLGIHQIGSLRVTNGAASPDPSVLPRNSTSSARPAEQDDYFTASEGSVSHQLDAQDDEEPHSSPEGRTDLLYPGRRDQSPLRKENSDIPPRCPRSPLGPREQPPSRPRSTEPTRQDNSLAAGTDQQPSDVSQIYLSEVTSNPFLAASDRILHDSLQTSPEAPGSPEDSPTTPRLNGDSLASVRSFPLSAASSAYTDHQAQHPQQSRQLVKVDSGYGSEASVTPACYAADMDPFDYASQTNNQSRPELTPKRSCLKGPDERAVVSTSNLLTPQREAVTTNLSTESVTTVNSSRASGSALTKSPSPFPDSLHSTTPTPTKSGPKKLQKKRRPTSAQQLKAEAFAVHGGVDVRNAPVPPPQEVLKQHSERLTKHPQMDSLEHTFDSTSSLHWQKRASAQLSIEAPKYEIRFPSPTPTDEVIKDQQRGRRSRNSSAKGEPKSRGFFRSRSRKDESREQKAGKLFDASDEVLGIADFGDITIPLGASPYDYARSTHTSRSPANMRHPGQIVYPHQLGVDRPRPKSFTGMDEKTASEFAYLKSRDRLLNSEMDSARPHLSQAPASDRPRGNRPRPRSWFVESLVAPPPVPDLPRPSRLKRPKSFEGKTSSFADRGREEPDYGQEEVFNDTESIAEDVGAGWERQARLWRQRRKSIGEGLRQRPAIEAEDAREGTRNQDKILPETSPAQAPVAAPEEDLFSRRSFPLLQRPPAVAQRSDSPTRSIRERAAMFERMSQNNGSEPAVRSPSPPKRAPPAIPPPQKETPRYYGTLAPTQRGRDDSHTPSPTRQLARNERTKALTHAYDARRAVQQGLDFGDVPVFVQRQSCI